MTKGGPQQHRFDALDSWRGLAALLIALLHYPAWWGWDSADNRDVWSVAVPFFFALSAFVLSHSIRNREQNSFRGFALRRFARLYPLHIVTALAMPPLYLASSIPRSFEAAGAVDQLLMLQYIGVSGEVWNPPAWSLSVEMWCGLLMFPLIAMKPTVWKAVALVAVAGGTLAPYYVDGGFLQRSSADLFGLTHLNAAPLLGIGCFAVGGLAYDFYRLANTADRRLISLLEIAVTVAAIWVLFLHPKLGNEWALLPLLAAVFIFPYQSGPISHLLRFKAVVYLGAISYSVYLLHFPLLLVLELADQVAENASYDLFRIYRGLWLDKLLYLAVLIWLSHLSFKYFEKTAASILAERAHHKIRVTKSARQTSTSINGLTYQPSTGTSAKKE